MSKLLICPNCGSDRIYSTETCTIDYPVKMAVDEHGVISHEYTGSDRITNDEGTEFVGELYCRGCTNEHRPADLVTLEAYAHRADVHIMDIAEDSNKGSDVRWQAVCWATYAIEDSSYECGWCGPWHYATDFVDEATWRSSQPGADWVDPGQLAYEAAEQDGREHLRGYGVASDSPTAPPSEDAGHGPADQEQAPQGAERPAGGGT